MAEATASDAHMFTQESDVTRGLFTTLPAERGSSGLGYRHPHPMIRGYCGPRPIRRTHQ